MCGRYSLAKDAMFLSDFFPEFRMIQAIAPRYNVAPGQPVVAVLNDGQAAADILEWGLIPSWAKDATSGPRPINARAETLHEKPSFRVLYQRKRCLIPADGFFEWKTMPGPAPKQPMYFRRKDHAPFMFAGLWDEWHDREGGMRMTCTIITTRPNPLVRPVHDRMPAILPRASWKQWMDSCEDRPDRLGTLLKPTPPDEWVAVPVSPRVNRVRFDDPLCILPQSSQVLEQPELFD